ncbi:hypothetical protein BJF85_22095 [Saccharomonospora sp. CUA-673]|uniref:helix-turn-helix transcriptional regulator n=1 Tax=Saccharomonospora sp. CUA-673 TaxID=1904969 RepID=UPI000966EC08|nr:LuxR family transcriptional regulator [Saccharomonospora sp. CUA-673]OLT42745.1 hypothetical protein BJF85_22095 [Saccharomonospora sp. CUA-673]
MRENASVARLGSSVPLIGRDAELTQLERAHQRARDGEAGGVVVAGDAGVGKTRLLAEFTERAAASGASVLTGRCLDLQSGGLPYLPIVEALGLLAGSAGAEEALASRPAVGRLLAQLSDPAASPVFTPAASAVGDDLTGVLGRSAPAEAGQLQLFEAILGLLGDLAATQPVVLVVEDLHWADASTRSLVSFLCSRLGRQRLLVVASYRADDVHRRHPLRPVLAELARLPRLERLDLLPLGPDDARSVVTALSDEAAGGLPPAVVDDLVARSEGNVFFAEELVAADAVADELPMALTDLLLARVERLGAATRRALRCAAVVGHGIGHAALVDLVGDDPEELEEALREAVHHHVLVADGSSYRFRHALLREAVYADLLPGERTRLHGAYAAWLAGGAPRRGRDAELAHHSLHAKDFPVALAAAVRAADEAERLGAPGSALRHLEQALDIVDAVPAEQRDPEAGHDEVTLLMRAAACAAASGEPERAITLARGAVERVGTEPTVDPVLAARAWSRLAEVLSWLDSTFDEGLDTVETAWQLLCGTSEGTAADRATVLELRARMLRAEQRYEEARVVADEALGWARESGDPVLEILVLVVVGGLADNAGYPGEARTVLAEARDRARELGAFDVEARAGYLLGVSHEDAGEVVPARELYGAALARAEAAGLRWSFLGISLRVRHLALRFATGDWPPEVGERRAAPSTTAEAFVGAGDVEFDIARGRLDEAAELIERLREHRRADLWIALAASLGGATVGYWRREFAGAAARAREGLDWIAADFPYSPAGIRVGAVGLEACAAWAAAARRGGDDPAPAVAAGEALWAGVRHCRDTSIPRSGEMGPEGRAWYARAEAAAGGLHGPADPAAWRAVVEAFDYGAVYEQAVCRLHLAEALLAAGDRDERRRDERRWDEAAGELAEADRVATELGAPPLRDAVRALARRAGIGTGPAPVPDVLTGRELSVLELVALGRTNRQIGAELYISEKTVSVHLSRAMGKLGVRRRAEAVAAAYERGLLVGEVSAGGDASAARYPTS